jgi:subtilisin family serine protease
VAKPTATGAGVDAYVIDTGIRKTHSQFRGRAVHGVDTTTPIGVTSDDCHGTHVAGAIGGSIHGVAKGVRLVAVRLLSCAGAGLNSGVIAGVDWVTGNHPPRSSRPCRTRSRTDQLRSRGRENHRRLDDEYRRPLELQRLRSMR